MIVRPAVILYLTLAALAGQAAATPTPWLRPAADADLGLLSPLPVQYGEPDVPDEDPGQSRDPAGPNPRVTQDIVNIASAGIEHCGTYAEAWRVDCLADELSRMAEATPNTPAYAAARAALRQAAADLNRIAVQNADPAEAPRVRAAEVDDRRRQTTRPIVPVAPARVAAANAAAEAVLDNLSTTLLRSAATPTARIEFARVAQAVDSTKILLRSS